MTEMIVAGIYLQIIRTIYSENQLENYKFQVKTRKT